VAKGQLRISLPTGYDYDELGRVRITPDEAVADAIANVVAYFDQLASARQVMLRRVAEGRRLPRRRSIDRQVLGAGVALVTALKPLVGQIKPLERQIGEAIGWHRDREIFLSLFRTPAQ
jgi:hypothetical protein